MSSTSNVQNLLVNVFRPAYTYGSSSGYVPSLVFSNVDTIISKTISVSNASINDGSNNVYVGSNAGNVYSNLRSSSNNVAVGYNAANLISNSTSNVLLGYNSFAGPLSNVSNTVAIGANTFGGGTNNIYIGTGTGSTGSSNIFLGNNIAPGNVSNQLRINTVLFGDLANKYVGIHNTAPTTSFDVSGTAYFRGKVGVQVPIPDKSLDVNGQTQSSGGFVSIQGTIVHDPLNDTNIGILKRGLILVSAVDLASSANSGAAVFFADSLSNAHVVSSNYHGVTTLTTSNADIKIFDTGGVGRTYGYTIAYFPIDTA